MGVLVLSARSCRGWGWGGKRLGKRELGARRNPAEQRDSFVSTAWLANRGAKWAQPGPLAGRCLHLKVKVMCMEERVDPGRDAGLFGPESVSWRVLREGSVVVGGLRALLMHAAHPLVVAGARQTGMYERDPWRRLERTLRQTFTVVFGTRLEAELAARRIDDVHGAIKGIDAVTGLRYDARDPELLLWVHACLVSSFLEMLRRTDDAMAVAALVRDPPDQVPKRWLWRLISFLSFHTLPPALRDLYGVRHTLRHELALRAVCWTMRHDRPFMPPRWRFIAPALAAGARLRGESTSMSGTGLFLRGAGWRVPRPRVGHAHGSRQSR